MIVLVMNLNYKFYWEAGHLVHVLLVDGYQITIKELGLWI